eukprot:SAG22_NODE_9874_length_565_cov_1.070815_1_plen_121_part_10
MQQRITDESIEQAWEYHTMRTDDRRFAAQCAEVYTKDACIIWSQHRGANIKIDGDSLENYRARLRAAEVALPQRERDMQRDDVERDLQRLDVAAAVDMETDAGNPEMFRIVKSATHAQFVK